MYVAQVSELFQKIAPLFSQEALRIHGMIESLHHDVIGGYQSFAAFLNSHPLNELLLATKTTTTLPMMDLFRKYDPDIELYDGKYHTPGEMLQCMNLYQAARLIQVSTKLI